MSRLLHCSIPLRSASTTRTFSTTANRYISLQLEKNHPETVADTVPSYPYGPARWYKQSDKGLYGGQHIQFGNNVGPKSKTKTRRSWHPNIFRKRLYSRALNRYVQVRVAARVLRTIDKLGGLDEYLLGEKEARVRELGMSGWWLRWAIMQTPLVRKRFATDRERLGMEVAGVGNVGEEAGVMEEGEDATAATALKGEEVSLEESEEVALEEEMETVATDGAFEVEQPPSLPPLKFRVGPKAHLVLTSQGWRRTRPDYERRMRHKILKRNEFLREYVDEKMLRFDENLERVIERPDDEMLQLLAGEGRNVVLAENVLNRVDDVEESPDTATDEVAVDAQDTTVANDLDEPLAQEDETLIHDVIAEEQQENVIAELQEGIITSEASIQLNELEKKRLMKGVRQVLRREAEGMLDKTVGEAMRRKAEGKKRRMVKGQEKRAKAERREKRLAGGMD